MQDQTTPRMFRVKVVADRYDVSVSTIYRAIESGQLEALRIGAGKGAVRIPEHALAAFEQSCGLGSGEDTAAAVPGMELKPGTLVEAVPTGVLADGSPITRPIRRRIDRAPWPGNPGSIVISDGTGVDAVNADSIRVIAEPDQAADTGASSVSEEVA